MDRRADRTAEEKWTGLQKLTDETYFAIITGQVPVDAFDEYVTTWKAQAATKSWRKSTSGGRTDRE